MDIKKLDLQYKVPFVIADGQFIGIHDNGMVDVVFWQARSQNEKSIQADAVAAIKYFKLEDLKRLRKAIDDTIQQHENREP